MLPLTKWRHLFEVGCGLQLIFARSRQYHLNALALCTRKMPMSGKKSGKRSSNRFLKVLGTGGSETPPSFYLFTDSQRYFFNCGSSTERFCLEHKIKFGKVADVFLTRPSWDCWGGLAAVALGQKNSQIAADSKLEINLYGPDVLQHYKKSIQHLGHGESVVFKPFMLNEDCAVVYRDDEIQITGVKLQTVKRETPSQLHGDETNLSEPPRKQVKLDSVQSSVVYLCQLADIPGKFDNAKAKSLGLKPGVIYANLVQGETVTAPNGTIVQPSDVLGSSFLGPLFVLVDCPNEAILSELLTAGKIFDSLNAQGRSVLVAHITPKSILEREDYQDWMGKFGPSCRHLLVHNSVCNQEFAFRGGLKFQAPLNTVSPSTFLVPQEENNCNKSEFHLVPSLKDASKQGRLMLVYHFYPNKKEGWDESECLVPVSDVVSDFLQNTRASLEVTKNSALLSEVVLPSSSNPKDTVVTFLGTGSSIPSKYRTVTSILLEFSTGHSMLLDCGEGSLSQLYRCYGRRADDIVRSLSCIFVSHMHGDHTLDIIHILKHHRQLQQSVDSTKPLLVLGPTRLGQMLSHYSRTCEELNYLYAVNYHHRHNSFEPPSVPVLAAAAELGLQSMQTVIVEHCWDAYGIVLDGGELAGKIVFSGDTRPCQDLIEVGKDARLLIHEATFEDELKEEALDRKHCILSEALEVAEAMRAGHTVLTHFSQRSVFPAVPPRILDEDSKVLVAFDCMRVELGQIDRVFKVQTAAHKLLACIS